MAGRLEPMTVNTVSLFLLTRDPTVAVPLGNATEAAVERSVGCRAAASPSRAAAADAGAVSCSASMCSECRSDLTALCIFISFHRIAPTPRIPTMASVRLLATDRLRE